MSDVIIEPRSQQNESHRHLSKKSEFKSASTIYKSTQENYDVLRTIYPSTSRFASEREYYYYIRSYGRATSAASYDKKHSSQFPSACKTWRSRRHLSLPLILTNDSSCQDITGPLFQQNITGRMCHCCIHFHLIHNTTGIRILCHYPLVSNN